jgi:hypothetical protein
MSGADPARKGGPSYSIVAIELTYSAPTRRSTSHLHMTMSKGEREREREIISEREREREREGERERERERERDRRKSDSVLSAQSLRSTYV